MRKILYFSVYWLDVELLRCHIHPLCHLSQYLYCRWCDRLTRWL